MSGVTRTEYRSARFARRFGRSRPLDPQIADQWTESLRVVRRGGLRAGGTVVDLGAGTGRFWPILRQAWSPSTIIAIEGAAEMLAAAPRADDVELVVADLDEPWWRAVRGDVVFCSMALHYSRDPRALCAAVFKLLPEDGAFVIRTATQESTRTNAVLRFFPSAVAAEARAFPGRAVFEGWLTAAGFQVETRTVSTPAAPDHLALVLRALRRGLPALQLVSNLEFIRGAARLAFWAAARTIGRRPIPQEQTVLIVARPA